MAGVFCQVLGGCTPPGPHLLDSEQARDSLAGDRRGDSDRVASIGQRRRAVELLGVPERTVELLRALVARRRPP